MPVALDAASKLSVPAVPLGQAAGAGEFPYSPIEDAVLDGSLYAALAQAKVAAAAAAAALSDATGGASDALRATGQASFVGWRSRPAASPSASAAATAAAAVAAAGGDSVAAEALAQLVATNPRASGSDLRSLLVQRLQDRSVLLDNPMGALKAAKLFASSTCLHIVTPGDRLRVVPLMGAVIHYQVNGSTLQLTGCKT
ncbi:hypothetical protein GPECTOR_1g670 [Gonium pectorale]|uniref:Uncharacterized protein n=1 Tax=Gonium pectorale TaxID=33097 RepID=A0A150H3W2_GONPE|nr:hypothetical protein GPECTOR_1g670 [Gonium pectorale]|eukprot:KXZ56744.1 hypothetical protein GPECTOR_1g670 [Gonium pectorale]